MFLRTVFTVGWNCGPTHYSHLRSAHKGFIQLLAFVYSSTTMSYSDIQRVCRDFSIVYFFLGQWHHQHCHAGQWIHSGIEALLIYIYKKDSFLLNGEKLLLVRGKELPSSWIAESSQSAHSWLSLCERWAMEVLKKCHGSNEFKWWMFFIMSSARIRTK